MNSLRCLSSLVVVTVAITATSPAVYAAADTIQQDVVLNLDRLGDGSMTIAFHLSASQWTIWKQQYGDRPDVLWRDLKQQFATLALGTFTLDKNDVERTATAKITVRGGTTLRSDGSREIEVPKQMKKISESGREWIFNSVNQEGYGAPILTQTIRIQLPPEAVNVRFNQPGTAFQSLVYEIPETSRGPTMLYAGLGALVVGLVLGVVGFLPGKKPVTAPA